MLKTRTYKKRVGGYTIIETMVSVSVFLVVVVSGMGAFLNANLLHEKTQDMRSITDSLSFIMEDISRSLRTGFQYRCIATGNPVTPINLPTVGPQSCASGYAIVFKPEDYPANGSAQWAYKFEANAQSNGLMAIWKTTNAQAASPTWVVLNPEEVIIDSFSGFPGFSVLGAESSSASPSNQQQPFVTIRISGRIILKNTSTPFSMQTSVSQRAIDP